MRNGQGTRGSRLKTRSDLRSEDLPNRSVASDRLEKILMVQEYFDGMHDLAAGVFGKSAAAAGIERLMCKFLGNLLDGKEQHGDSRMFARNLSCRLQPVHVRHGQIQDHNVRINLFGLVYCLMPVPRVGTHRPACTGFDQPAEQTPDRSVIIGDEYSH